MTGLRGRTWWYNDKYINPEKTITEIRSRYGTINSSPVFFGYWSKVYVYNAAVKDVKENLHSLIQKRMCSCGLTFREDQPYEAILTSSNHRNHVTLEREPNPKFRGKVGRRLVWPMMPLEAQHEVDKLWDQIVETIV